MTALDQMIWAPRLVETEEAEIDAATERVWTEVRHGNLGQPRLSRALFWLGTLPGSLTLMLVSVPVMCSQSRPALWLRSRAHLIDRSTKLACAHAA